MYINKYLVVCQVGLAQSVLLYLAVNWFESNYIFLNFAVSHTHLDVVAKDDTTVSSAPSRRLPC
jgi:hypothetical protein